MYSLIHEHSKLWLNMWTQHRIDVIMTYGIHNSEVQSFFTYSEVKKKIHDGLMDSREKDRCVIG